MIKNSETYTHEATSISFTIRYDSMGKPTSADISNHRGQQQFVFRGSGAETILAVGKAIVEIGDFIKSKG